eukprot:scaffold16561_cov117-Cyclotella_meneghiniana.AAC.5
MGIDTNQRDRVTALKVSKPESIHPVRFTHDKNYVWLQLVNTFVEGLAELKEGRQPHDGGEDNGQGKPYKENTIGSLDLLELLQSVPSTFELPKEKVMTEEECVEFFDSPGEPFVPLVPSPTRRRRSTRDVPIVVSVDDSQSQSTSLTTNVSQEEEVPEEVEVQEEVPEDQEEERRITRMLARPFIVYSSSKEEAHIITHVLKVLAYHAGMRTEDIRMVCAETKGSTPWHQRFESNANRYAPFAQVLVCTSVMDTGVSITKPYVRFIAFLDPGILTFEQALQFIVRAR